LWLATWTIGRIGADKSDELRAFLAKLRGATGASWAATWPGPIPSCITGFARMTIVGGGALHGRRFGLVGDDHGRRRQPAHPAGGAAWPDAVGRRLCRVQVDRDRRPASPDCPGRQWSRVVTGGMADDSPVTICRHQRTAGAQLHPADRDRAPGQSGVRHGADHRPVEAGRDRPPPGDRGGTVTGVQDLRA
jgi:hypothetical protein